MDIYGYIYIYIYIYIRIYMDIYIVSLENGVLTFLTKSIIKLPK